LDVPQRKFWNLEEMEQPAMATISPQPSLHFPLHLSNEFKISLITLRIHRVTLLYIFTFPSVKIERKQTENEGVSYRETVRDWHEIALEANGVSFPL
jgi:hypothetical protein